MLGAAGGQELLQGPNTVSSSAVLTPLAVSSQPVQPSVSTPEVVTQPVWPAISIEAPISTGEPRLYTS